MVLSRIYLFLKHLLALNVFIRPYYIYLFFNAFISSYYIYLFLKYLIVVNAFRFFMYLFVLNAFIGSYYIYLFLKYLIVVSAFIGSFMHFFILKCN